MTWIVRQLPPAHTCEQPNEGRIGDVWGCDSCRSVWRRARACDICDAYGYHYVGQCRVGLTWRPVTGLRARRLRRKLSA